MLLVLAAAETAVTSLVVYGLSRLAALAAELEGLREQLARMAAVRERLRIARDVHDLLGAGLVGDSPEDRFDRRADQTG